MNHVENKNYYKTLGVDRTADAETIKKAFRKLARQHHPDANKGDKKAEEKFKEINEAYEVLSDPEKRKLYDQLGSNFNQYRQAPPNGRSAGGTGAPAACASAAVRAASRAACRGRKWAA